MKIRKNIFYLICIIVFFLLQSSFFTYLTVADVVPNLLIILTATTAIMEGSAEGCIIGFFCGILLDISYGQTLGMYALGFTLIGYLTGFFNRIFYREDITFPIIVILFSDIFYGLYMYLTGFLIRGRVAFLPYLFGVMLPEAVYTVIVAIFVYFFMQAMLRKLE